MYLDSAIVVKLLVREADSQWFNHSLAGEHLETSELALTEVRSALLAKERTGQITARERVAATEKFRSMVEDELIRLLALNRAVLERASEIQFACHPRIPLRTLDALHVAACELHRCGKMCATDGRMRAACDQFAIALLPARMEDIAAGRTKQRR
jgi:predicted nucleic acid-binding protein